MNKARLLILLAVLMLPFLAQAQDDEAKMAIEAMIEQLAARCPSPQGDQWVINSVKMVDDTVDVELCTPSSLAGFLPMLTGENPKAKKLWLNHLSNYGDEWKQLVELLAEEGLPMRLLLKAKGSETAHGIFFVRNEVGTILASD
jgi:hypothetical protein